MLSSENVSHVDTCVWLVTELPQISMATGDAVAARGEIL